MLTDLGVPLLRWLDDIVLPDAHRQLDRLHGYVKRWRWILLDHPYRSWPNSHPEIR